MVRKTSDTKGDLAERKGYEEQLTEGALRYRLKQILNWHNKVSETRYDKNATPEQRSGIEQLEHYFLLLDMISGHVLRLKIAERMTKMSEKEKKEEILQNQKAVQKGEADYHWLIGGREKSLSQIEECRQEIAQEQDLYQALLTAFQVQANSPLRPVTISARSDAPLRFTSKWKKIVKRAISSCGEKVHYGVIASWMSDNYPNVELPTYCAGYERPDIGWLVINEKQVAKGFQSDVSRVRREMRKMQQRK
jgi:hypothetical protein